MGNSLQNVDEKKSTLDFNGIDNASKNIKSTSQSQIISSNLFNKKSKFLTKKDLSARKISTSIYDFFESKKPSSTKDKLDMNNIIPPIRIKKEKIENNATYSNAADNLKVANNNNKSSAETGNQFKKTSKKMNPK